TLVGPAVPVVSVSQLFQAPVAFFARPDLWSPDPCGLFSGCAQSRCIGRLIYLRELSRRQDAGGDGPCEDVAGCRPIHPVGLWRTFSPACLFGIMVRRRESHLYGPGWFVCKNGLRRRVSLG